LRWDALGYGKDKGIIGTLIASCTFDNIANIILFNICKTIAFEYAEQKNHETHIVKESWEIGLIFIQNLAGLVGGVFLGLFSWLFTFLEKKSYCMYLKCAFAMTGAIGLIIASETTHYKNAKYIGCLSFGYVCFRFWGENKPTKMIADCWFFI